MASGGRIKFRGGKCILEGDVIDFMGEVPSYIYISRDVLFPHKVLY